MSMCHACGGTGSDDGRPGPKPAEFFFLSLKHTRPGDTVLTWWRPNQRGYVWNLDDAGRYTAEEAKTLDGVSSVAIPCEVALAAACRYVEFDSLRKLGLTQAQWRKGANQ